MRVSEPRSHWAFGQLKSYSSYPRNNGRPLRNLTMGEHDQIIYFNKFIHSFIHSLKQCIYDRTGRFALGDNVNKGHLGLFFTCLVVWGS